MKRMAEVRGTWKQRAPKRNANLVSEFKRSDKQLAAKSAGRIKQRGPLPDPPPTQSPFLSPLRPWARTTAHALVNACVYASDVTTLQHTTPPSVQRMVRVSEHACSHPLLKEWTGTRALPRLDSSRQSAGLVNVCPLAQPR